MKNKLTFEGGAINPTHNYLRIFFTLFVISLSFQNLYAQTQTDFDSLVFKAAIHDKRKVFLLPVVSNYDQQKIKQTLSADSFTRSITYSLTGETVIEKIIISRDERKYIDSCLQANESFTWTAKKKEQTGLSNFELLDTATALKIIPDFDRILFAIGKPLFIRNNAVCFFFYTKACGSLCGHGELLIMKKENGIWKRWWTLYSYNS